MPLPSKSICDVVKRRNVEVGHQDPGSLTSGTPLRAWWGSLFSSDSVGTLPKLFGKLQKNST